MILNLLERTLIVTGILESKTNFLPETGEKLYKGNMSIKNNKLFTNMSASDLLTLFNDMLVCETYCWGACHHERSEHYSIGEIEDELLRRLNEYDKMSG